MMDGFKMFPILLILIGHLSVNTYSCNEAVCGSVVSKCLLTKACNCDYKAGNCTCCKDCNACLGNLFYECCSCVGQYINCFITCVCITFLVYYRDVQKTQH